MQIGISCVPGTKEGFCTQPGVFGLIRGHQRARKRPFGGDEGFQGPGKQAGGSRAVLLLDVLSQSRPPLNIAEEAPAVALRRVPDVNRFLKERHRMPSSGSIACFSLESAAFLNAAMILVQ